MYNSTSSSSKRPRKRTVRSKSTCSLKNPQATATPTSPSASSTLRRSMLTDFDMEHTVQEVTSSSSAEGSVLKEGTVLARITNRYTQKDHKKLQPWAKSKFVRAVESVPPINSNAIDEWAACTFVPTCTFESQAINVSRPGESFVCELSFQRKRIEFPSIPMTTITRTTATTTTTTTTTTPATTTSTPTTPTSPTASTTSQCSPSIERRDNHSVKGNGGNGDIYYFGSKSYKINQSPKGKNNDENKDGDTTTVTPESPRTIKRRFIQQQATANNRDNHNNNHHNNNHNNDNNREGNNGGGNGIVVPPIVPPIAIHNDGDNNHHNNNNNGCNNNNNNTDNGEKSVRFLERQYNSDPTPLGEHAKNNKISASSGDGHKHRAVKKQKSRHPSKSRSQSQKQELILEEDEDNERSNNKDPNATTKTTTTTNTTTTTTTAIEEEADDYVLLTKVQFHRYHGTDGLIFRIETRCGNTFYLLVRAVVNKIHLELPSTALPQEMGTTSEPDDIEEPVPFRWLDTPINPKDHVGYFRPQALVGCRFSTVSNNSRAAYLPFIIHVPEDDYYRGNMFRLMFTVVGEGDEKIFAISDQVEVGEGIEFNKRSLSKTLSRFVRSLEFSHPTMEIQSLLRKFTASIPRMLQIGIALDSEEEKGAGAAIFVDLVKLLKEAYPGDVLSTPYYDGKTLLHYSILLDNVEATKYIISNCRSCINASDVNMQNPLWFAVDSNSPDTISILMKAGADLHLRDVRGYNILDFARTRKPIRHNVVRLLSACTVSSRPKFKTMRNLRDSTYEDALFGASKLHRLAARGFLEQITSLDADKTDINISDYCDTKPLHQAIRAGHLDVANYFMASPKLQKDATDCLGYTALNLACIQYQTKIVEDLLDLGATHIPDKFGFTPLHNACAMGHRDLVVLLLERLSREEFCECAMSVPEYTPYHLAAANGHHGVLELLLKHNSTILQKMPCALTAAHLASKRNHVACVKMLSRYDMPLLLEEKETKLTPLHFAAFHGHDAVVELLLSASPTTVDAKDLKGNTALSMAAMSTGNTNCLKILLDAGAQLEGTTERGETPLFIASQNGLSAAVSFLLSRNASVQHVQPDTGYTCLHMAAWGGHEECLNLLLAAGAGINEEDLLGCTPLMAALHFPASVALLASKGSNINHRNKDGKTAVYLALERRLIDVSTLLIGRGADVWVKDNDGNCAMDLDLAENKDLILDVVKTAEEKKDSANALIYKEAIMLFNQKASHGIDFLKKSGVLKSQSSDIAWLFTNYNHQLSKIQLGIFLGGEDELNLQTLKAFTNRINFAGMSFDRALRHYLQFFMLPGEAQKIDRMMECFAIRYHETNSGVFPDADTAFILAFALIMLNTDHHNPNIKVKMTKEEFLRNNRGQWGPDHMDPPRDLYIQLYEAISNEEIEFEREGYIFGGAERKGYLKKFSPTGWTKRYFILKDSCLYYFKNQKESEQPHGIIVLENLAVKNLERKKFVLITKDGSPVKYCKMSSSGVMVQGTQKEITFHAESEAVRDDWVATIQTNVAENPFHQLLAKRMGDFVEAQHARDVPLSPEHVAQFLEWAEMLKSLEDENALRERWGDSVTKYDCCGNVKFALIEEGKDHKIVFHSPLLTTSFLQPLRQQKSTKFDFMNFFSICEISSKIATSVTPYLRKYNPTQLCGFGLGSIVAIHVGLLLQAENYLVTGVVTFGQPNVVSAKDFSSCSLLGILRILLPKDPCQCLFDNYAHAGQQVILQTKGRLETAPSFVEQISRTPKFPKLLLKKECESKCSLAAYEKALQNLCT